MTIKDFEKLLVAARSLGAKDDASVYNQGPNAYGDLLPTVIVSDSIKVHASSHYDEKLKKLSSKITVTHTNEMK